MIRAGERQRGSGHAGVQREFPHQCFGEDCAVCAFIAKQLARKIYDRPRPPRGGRRRWPELVAERLGREAER